MPSLSSSDAEDDHQQTTKLIDARSQPNPNVSWLQFRGVWVTNLLMMAALKILFGIIPAISVELSWTLTNIAYNAICFLVFHYPIGTPFEFNQGACDGLTLWEQIDNGSQFTPTKKFFTAMPIFLFLLSTHYTNYDASTFLLSLGSLLLVILPKLGSSTSLVVR